MNITTEIITETCKTINLSNKETFMLGVGSAIFVIICLWLMFKFYRGDWRSDP